MPFIEEYLTTHPETTVITDVDGYQGLTSAETLRYNNWMRTKGYVVLPLWRKFRGKIRRAEGAAYSHV